MRLITSDGKCRRTKTGLSTSIKENTLYCRLSRDDGNVQESSSIQTQKEILSRYARENGINDTTFYVEM